MRRFLKSPLFYLVISFLLFIPHVKYFLHEILYKSVYAPILGTEAYILDLVKIRSESRKWLEYFIRLNPSIQRDFLQKMDSLWSVTEPDTHGVIAHALAFSPMIIPPERILINKGKKDGVDYGSAVVYGGNFVAKVVNALDNESWANTIFNPNLRVGVVITPSGMLGVLKGNKIPEVHYLPAWAKVSVGDSIWTSGIGKLIPPGLLVGTVSDIDTLPTNPFYLVLRCKPAYEFTVSGVYVVLRRQETAFDDRDTIDLSNIGSPSRQKD